MGTGRTTAAVSQAPGESAVASTVPTLTNGKLNVIV
jgi:hypothetical protein